MNKMEKKQVSLGDLADPAPGSSTIGPFGSDLVALDYRASGRPVIFVRDIKENEFNWVSNTYVSEAKARSLKAHSVIAGDLLMTKMGMPPGVAAVYPSDLPDGIVTADVIRVRVNSSLVDVRWLARTINHENFARQVRGITGGVTRPKVTLGDVRSLKVELPELREQRRIAEILDALDAQIAAELEELAKRRLLRNAAVRRAMAPGLRLIDSVDASRFGEIEGLEEDGWSPVRLGSLLTRIEAGVSPDLDDRPAGHGEWGVLKVSAIGPDGFRPMENKVVFDRSLRQQDLCISAGELIMTRANTSDLVGLSCVVPEVAPHLMLSDKTLRLVVDPRKVSPGFVDLVLGAPEVRKQIQIAATGTSASMKNISQSSVRALMAPFSDSLMMEKVCKIDSEMRKVLESQRGTVTALRDLKRGLVEDLLTGRVRV